MRRFLTDVPHGIPSYSYGKWNVAITDMQDVAAWVQELRTTCPIYAAQGPVDGKTPEKIADALRDGDTEMATASEHYMHAFDDLSFSGRKFAAVASVAGGAPNVGAHLAGSPVAMRRRDRVLSTVGALTIFVDGSSSGDVETEALKRRGAALLGLMRALQSIRPVDLYVVGGGMPNCAPFTRNALTCSVFVKIDGVMDLSRDGFAVAHPSFTRGFLYRACGVLDPREYHGMLGWEFGDVNIYKENALGAFCNAIGCDPEQAIFFSPPHSDDPVITDPVAWIRDMLARYGGAPMEAAA